ncbi:hypothetical protein DSJ_05770 [Pantoea stewartii subsp. stewartii DC283]|uniref:HTH lacI-type domain-containing protein n=1 Tax=Pantoea stewartii subsp. stewartii DC283 TaxID=660596 RepID=A0ABM6K2C5_PANSE|nr:hypothetical protein DSJ_05770 [Pantoea stewartii subsp. stewartii DC283]
MASLQHNKNVRSHQKGHDSALYEKFFICRLEGDHRMKQSLKVSEIAALSGVSVSTVSRVLAGKANIRPATRDKVRKRHI